LTGARARLSVTDAKETSTMAADGFDYEKMAQEALRGVVREALKRVQKTGALPGRHHFYLTFKTRHPGVDIADEMTIVLEHQFYDLTVTERRFEVTLRFAGVPQHLVIPFGALTRFYDPSVRFGLQFEAVEDETDRQAAKAAPLPEPEAAGSVVVLDAFRRK
jgi:hypothetical protein